jgi:FkbM family methyltransferase
MSVNIDLITEIANHHSQHSRSSSWWEKMNQKCSYAFSKEFDGEVARINFVGAGEYLVHNVNFGSISSVHLFGLDELILFAWYQVNSKKYHRTLDLGANIGVHSMLMSKLGFDVTAYEPDPNHIEYFIKSMQSNSITGYQLREKAIGITSEKLSFTRVLGNTTGSHISGAKKNPYGELDIFEIESDGIREVISEGFDFIKMDVEGYEVQLISALQSDDFNRMEMMVEIGTSENATKIYSELNRLGVNAFAQKINWGRVASFCDLPTSHREGSLFLTNSARMNWTY